MRGKKQVGAEYEWWHPIRPVWCFIDARLFVKNIRLPFSLQFCRLGQKPENLTKKADHPKLKRHKTRSQNSSQGFFDIEGIF